MPRVTFFEIGVDQAARAKRFYEGVFGWKMTKWEGPVDYWLISTGEGEPGIDGAILPRRMPTETTTNTVSVPNLDKAVASVIKHGGKLVVPKVAVPTMGWLAYCQDTEGNVFGLMQEDHAAK
jgi:uncharacterized protein